MKNLIILFAIILCSCYAAFAQIPLNGLVANYPFNGNANDESGNGNDCIVSGATLTFDRFGNLNSAYSFAGNYKSIRQSVTYNLANYNYTYSVWVKLFSLPSNGDSKSILSIGDAATGDQLITIGNYYLGQPYYGFSCGGYFSPSNTQVSANFFPNLNQWYNIIVSKDSSLLKLFIDGVLIGTTSTVGKTPIYGTTQISISGRAADNIQYLDGIIDDIRIYNRALNNQEIQTLYHDIPEPAQSCLVASYPFNGNANDESGNGNNGTVNGATITTDRFGNANSAYSLDGANNYIQTTDFAYYTSFTASLWIKLTSNQQAGLIQHKDLGSWGDGWLLSYEGTTNSLSWGVIDGSGWSWRKFTTSQLNLEQWYHVTWVSDGATYHKLFLDGILLDQATGGYLTLGNTPLIAGAWGDGIINQYFNGKIDDIRIYNCALSEDEIYILSNQTSCEFSDCNSTTNCGVNDSIDYEAVQYLCSQGVVKGYQSTGTVAPTSYIQRQDLAKILFKGLYGSGYSVTTPADNFPTLYSDLQTTGTLGSYHRYARVLCYLEYDNGKSVFDRNFFNFRPTGKLQRMSFLKALLETWNILPDNGISVPFADVATDHPLYGYLAKAYSLGILDNMTATNFRPSDWCSREEAFIMLYKIMTNSNCIALKPTTTQLQDINNYFVPGLYTTSTLGKLKGMEQGNFNHYTKTSFTIADIKHALNFEHTYNSYTTELPDYFYPQTPLGKGWSHTYNSYILFDKNDAATDDRYIIYWSNSEINVYDANTSMYITKGIYDQFNKSGNTITITKKDQTQFIYQNLTSDTSLVMYLLTEIKDRNNNSTVISYETGADLVFINYHDTVSHPMKRINHVQVLSGRQLLFSYKPNTNLIDNVTDPLSRSISFDYTNGTLTTFTDAKGQATTYNYGNITDPKESYLLMSITLPKGNIIYNTYSKRKLVTTKYNSDSPTQISLNTANNGNYNYSNSNEYMQATITDPMNRTYDYKTNDNGLTTSFTGQDINTSLTYPTTGANATKPTNVNYNSIAIDYEYDNNGNVTKITKPGSITEEFTYNSTNDLLTHKDPRNNITTLTYDGNGNVTQISDPLSNVATFAYSSNGLLTSATNPANIQVAYTYNSYGNLSGITKPLGLSTTYSYDNASRITSATKDALTTSYQYDENDNPTQVTDALSQTIQYQYDANDNKTKFINQKGISTNLAYDDQDRLITETFGSSVNQYSYNSDGLLATFTKPGGEAFNYSYDAYGRMSSNSFITNTVYDSRNNITSISNSNGTLNYVYDNLNRIIKITDYYGNDVEYTYDNASNITQIKYPGNKTVDYVFDANNRMTSLTDWNGKTVSYTYRSDGLITSTIYPNGITCTYSYDAAGRLTGIEHKKADNTVIASYQYTLDARNNITNETIIEPCTNSPNPVTSNISLTYDNYNRIQSDGSNTYTHNTNGNITAINSSSLSYDLMDNLTTCTLPNFQASYSYDAFGDRTSATRNGQTVKYVLDRLAMPNVLMETDNSGNPINYYVYGIGLVSRVKPNGTHNYYHQDYRGSIVAMTDSVENTTHSYAYDAFGNIAQLQEQDYNPFRYVGMHGVMYEDSSLYFMRARYYNNKMGRFMSEDPVWGTNLYAYADNNPITKIDPLGLSAGSIVIDAAFDAFDEDAPGQSKLQKGIYSVTKSYVDDKTLLGGYTLDITEKAIDGKSAKVIGVEMALDKAREGITYGVIKAFSWCPPIKALDNEAGRKLLNRSSQVVGDKIGGQVDRFVDWSMKKTGLDRVVIKNRKKIRNFLGIK